MYTQYEVNLGMYGRGKAHIYLFNKSYTYMGQDHSFHAAYKFCHKGTVYLYKFYIAIKHSLAYFIAYYTDKVIMSQ